MIEAKQKKVNTDYKTIIKLTLPIFLELVLQLLVGNVDKVMVRNDVFATAINQANSILDLLVVTLSLLAAASLILINQYKGSGDVEKERKIYKLSFYLNLFIGIIISLIILFFAEPMFRAMNVSDDVIPYALIYIRITGGFVFFHSIMLSIAAYLRSNEFMVTSLIISIVFNVLNIGLNALFLYVFRMNGTMGVAIASSISRFVGCVILILVFLKKTKISLSMKGLFPIEKSELKKILSIAIPASAESFSYSFSQIVILAIINIIGFKLSQGAPTAKTYASMIANCTYLFVSAISQGMQIMLGRYLGAGEIEKADNLVKKTAYISVCVSMFLAVVIALISRSIFSLLTQDEEVISLCVKIMYIEIALEFGRAVNIVLVRGLQTSGDVMFPTIMAVISCWIIATLGSYILGVVCNLGIVGVWISMAVDEVFRAIIFIIRWRIGKWKRISLIENNTQHLKCMEAK